MAMPGRAAMNSVPVLIEASSTGSFDQQPDLIVEVCGSWTDHDFVSFDEQEGRLRECIADAMVDRPPSPNGLTLTAGKNRKLARLVNFQTNFVIQNVQVAAEKNCR